MSTIIDPQLERRPYLLEDDPFRYGIRYQRIYRDDGTFTVKEIPLRQEDLLFPEEEDHPVVTDGHQTDLINLMVYFKTQLRHVAGAAVVGDLRIDFASADPAIRPLGPDVAVIFGVREHRDWSTFHVGREGTRPSLIVEVTSPATRTFDLENKVDLYYRVGVQWYVIVDREEGARKFTSKFLAINAVTVVLRKWRQTNTVGCGWKRSMLGWESRTIKRFVMLLRELGFRLMPN